MTIARSVAPGREGEFEDWSATLTGAASRWPGFLGAGLLRPGHVGEPWHVVFRFASAADLAAWDSSPERAEILAAGEPLVHATDVHRVSGLETWFTLPGRTAPAPPRWKMFLTALLATYALQLVVNVGAHALAGSWPLPLRLALYVTVVTAAMTWLVMPWLAGLLARWLYPRPRERGGPR